MKFILCVDGDEICKSSALYRRRTSRVTVAQPARLRASFDQVSEFDRGRIVTNRDCGLSFKEIGQHVGRNQARVIRIRHHWIQEETTDRRGRTQPLPVMTDRLCA
ncbi:hypothetical protein TNCV_4853761 [Trichonephila clavipes]|nr:hypothetical protein TNCV_4853761 [Trichonephila clavipes]